MRGAVFIIGPGDRSARLREIAEAIVAISGGRVVEMTNHLELLCSHFERAQVAFEELADVVRLRARADPMPDITWALGAVRRRLPEAPPMPWPRNYATVRR